MPIRGNINGSLWPTREILARVPLAVSMTQRPLIVARGIREITSDHQGDAAPASMELLPRQRWRKEEEAKNSL